MIIMKKIIILLTALALSVPLAGMSYAKGGHYYPSHSSSHKGGKYHNPSTGNHYIKHH